ncbi:MAG: primosomal protein N', partial [Desulfobacterales bacterium]|nr:primosomal protein N' [Desulfobacterales bacterium]
MPTRPKQIEVAVAMPVFGTYTYEVPAALEGMVEAGKRVLVPFGSRRITGYVLGDDSRDTAESLKTVDDVIDDDTPVFPAEMIPFFRWIADYYIHPIGEVISDALPGGINPSEHAVFSPTADGIRALEQNRLTETEQKILAQLNEKACRWAALCRSTNEDIPRSLLEKMRRQGLIGKQHKLQRQTVRTKTERCAKLADPDADDSGLSEPKALILEHLRTHGQTPVAALKKIVPTAAAHVRDLAQKKIVCIVEQEVYRDPFGDPVIPDTPPRLTA